MSDPSSAAAVIRELKLAQREFYEKAAKNVFFKKSQKMECARLVFERFDLATLMAHTCYPAPGSGARIFLDYPVFKMFANERNYGAIVAHIMALLDRTIAAHGGFEFHVDLDSFTVSAAERYRPIIDIFSNACLASNTLYSELMGAMHVYHTPSVVDAVSKMLGPIVPPVIKTKLRFLSKVESPERLRALLAPAGGER